MISTVWSGFLELPLISTVCSWFLWIRPHCKRVSWFLNYGLNFCEFVGIYIYWSWFSLEVGYDFCSLVLISKSLVLISMVWSGFLQFTLIFMNSPGFLCIDYDFYKFFLISVHWFWFLMDFRGFPWTGLHFYSLSWCLWFGLDLLGWPWFLWIWGYFYAVLMISINSSRTFKVERNKTEATLKK